MTNETTTPRIYVASLADYNNGTLHGVWIDADQTAEEIEEQVQAMLRQSKYPNVRVTCPACDGTGDGRLAESFAATCPGCLGAATVPSAEEWAIHDYEGFGGIRLGESESFETVAALAQLVADHGEAFAAWWDCGCYDAKSPDEWAEQFEEQYWGEFRSVEEWAEEYLESTDMLAEVPEHVRNYIDVAAWARDAQLGGDIWVHEQGYGRVFIFHNS